ncbi:MAG: hypothetical protein WC346_12905 [Methanogenium sp.]|jgi:hypothetical protein
MKKCKLRHKFSFSEQRVLDKEADRVASILTWEALARAFPNEDDRLAYCKALYNKFSES